MADLWLYEHLSHKINAYLFRYKCDKCDKSFSQGYTLKSHVQSSHAIKTESGSSTQTTTTTTSSSSTIPGISGTATIGLVATSVGTTTATIIGAPAPTPNNLTAQQAAQAQQQQQHQQQRHLLQQQHPVPPPAGGTTVTLHPHQIQQQIQQLQHPVTVNVNHFQQFQQQNMLHNPNGGQCRLCGRMFYDKDALKKHVVQDHIITTL